jgi:hypothetical protein
MRGCTPVVGLLGVVHGDWWSSWWGRGCPPSTVSRCGWGVAYPISRRSTPLIYNWPIGNIRIVSRLGSFNLNLLVLNVYIMFGHCLVHCAVVFETQKAKSPGFLFLLVVHDDHLRHAAIAVKVAPEVCFSDAGREAAQENFWPICVLLRFLHRAWVTWFWVNRSSV